MPYCPNCGETIMNGDPYCSSCGSHLRWDLEPSDRSGDERYGEDGLDDILNSMFISEIQRDLLKIKLQSMLKAKDVTGLLMREGRGEYIFEFTRENQYVKTLDRFFYSPKDQNVMRVFCDSESTHYHDGLLKDQRFKRMVEKTGLELIGCRGGHKVEYEFYPGRFDLADEIDIIVYFRISEHKERLYHLDLDKMELKSPHDYDV
jgi:hypothetical protein